ncbi:hypothetical protein B0A50_07751 [Salinomyces thailandicus]|uniref:Uncharacterized protein n=1 Tax=Salinomyces thailandicus TaxID=706561 RepID=A0A4U0TLM5_9PEZI|nr:hypothetical protein B0A50_07751 [Salinomyces thailandica]
MRYALLSSIACLATLAHSSPIANPPDSDASPLEERNLLVPGYLIPTTTVNPATWPTASWTGTPILLPTSTVILKNKRNPDVTSLPNLVPTSTVNPATWSTESSWTGTPDFMPTTVVHLGTTTGCVVSMASYTFDDEPAYSYVTYCSASQISEATAAITSMPECCGGEEDVYPCNAAGSMPTGTERWVCSSEGEKFAGTRFATTTWT